MELELQAKSVHLSCSYVPRWSWLRKKFTLNIYNELNYGKNTKMMLFGLYMKAADQVAYHKEIYG